MMLLNDFYSLLQHDPADSSVTARISINRNHKILQGHFPGLPIVPGVCMMQIIREIMEVTIKKPLRLVAADNMKFLTVINPEKNSEVEATVLYTKDDDQFLINATLFLGTVTFFKLKATLKTSAWSL
ncbi:MAG: hydroxymyristoyl-ACP dehydratase [Cyclobacteriaceae bacterium]|jgi:3-hydroxyacyl-[acyl-carrier-protein] dehydratase|nr:hydroxymyristoyl-ACP dehydratase [Cyclobacteriaceae bacterium]